MEKLQCYSNCRLIVFDPDERRPCGINIFSGSIPCTKTLEKIRSQLAQKPGVRYTRVTASDESAHVWTTEEAFLPEKDLVGPLTNTWKTGCRIANGFVEFKEIL